MNTFSLKIKREAQIRRKITLFLLIITPFLLFILVNTNQRMNAFVSYADVEIRSIDALSHAICVSIDTSIIWRIGNTAEDLNNQLRNAIIKVNGKTVDQNKSHVRYFSALFIEDDPFGFGIPIGSHGGDVDLCTDVSGLNLGEHIAEIWVRTTFYETYYYNWKFVVK